MAPITPPPRRCVSPQMPKPTREDLGIFLATSSESNIHGRADHGSPWIGVPCRKQHSNVFVKKEHNEPFTVSIVHKDEEYDRVENVLRLYIQTDIWMCSIGSYHALFDFEKGVSEQVVAIQEDGTKHKWNATLGDVKAPDFRTLQVHLSPEPERNEILVYKHALVDWLNAMMNPSTLPCDREQASNSIDIVLPLFRGLTL